MRMPEAPPPVRRPAAAKPGKLISKHHALLARGWRRDLLCVDDLGKPGSTWYAS